VLVLYRGPLLPDHDAAWAESARERMRSQVSRFVAAATRRLEEAGERGAAEALAARALGSDPGLPLGGVRTAVG
jgi:two-component SAPR family response regulator